MAADAPRVGVPYNTRNAGTQARVRGVLCAVYGVKEKIIFV